MSFYNQDVDELTCHDCNYRLAPYLSKYGTETPCIECKYGSNASYKGAIKIALLNEEGKRK